MKEEAGDSEDIFSQISKWMAFAQECNQTFINDALDNIAKPFQEIDSSLDSLSSFSNSLLSGDPACMHKLIDNQLELMTNQLSLVEATVERMAGKEAEPIIRPSVTDRRFMDDEWQENPFFDFVKQSYLLNSQALNNIAACLDLPETDKERVNFYTRQISSALSPSNYPLTNPEIVRKIKETNGDNIYKGLKKFISDKKKSASFINVCMSDADCFKVGVNIAHTPGKVVFENELIQLIQYTPSQSTTHKVPILFTPSWVNKYYIFDLREKNSMVKWALEQGLTVFMISWVNPDASHRNLIFDDYLQQGVFTAIEQAKSISGAETVNCVGYCLGGALLAIASAYLAKKKDNSIGSVTYLATSFDFTNPGDIRVMLDDSVIEGLGHSINETGYMDGRSLALTFSLLRENELYWNYYIQNYLKGERPSGFDILHWNSDSTNIPAKTHMFVLEQIVRQNKLGKSDGLEVLGEKIDLSKIDIPVYILATEKDHIAKWQSCYPAIELFSGPTRFVLAGSGHIAGVINPPKGNKYHYYVNAIITDCAENWLDGAFKTEGSWWPDWYQWVSQYAGEKTHALEINEESVIEAAPGRYVKRRLDEADRDEPQMHQQQVA